MNRAPRSAELAKMSAGLANASSMKTEQIMTMIDAIMKASEHMQGLSKSLLSPEVTDEEVNKAVAELEKML